MRDDSANTVRPYPWSVRTDGEAAAFDVRTSLRERDSMIEKMCCLQLNSLAHEERPRPKAVKSSLKGSSSQLSLEEVAAAARRNAARRHTRKAADTVLKSLLNTAEKARKVCLVMLFRSRPTNISSDVMTVSNGDGGTV